VLWTAEVEAADGIAISDRLVTVIGGEELACWSISNGECLWAVEAPRTSGPTAMEQTVDEVFVYGEWERWMAFDLANGRQRPSAVVPTRPRPDQVLWPGYEVVGNELLYRGENLWTFRDRAVPVFARFGDTTLVNDDWRGLWEVEDDGRSHEVRPTSRRRTSISPIVQAAGRAATVLSDEQLLVLAAGETGADRDETDP
jgi:hypothetical protein